MGGLINSAKISQGTDNKAIESAIDILNNSTAVFVERRVGS